MVTVASSTAYTQHALETFFKYTTLNTDDVFVLIDNDKSFSFQDQRWADCVHLHVNDAPLCFGYNGNQLIELCREHKADLYFLNNDLAFTPNWLNALVEGPSNAILSPYSNMLIEYQVGNWETKIFFDLKDYLGHEADVEKVARIHAENYPGYTKVPFFYFYGVKIPYVILNEVGDFDPKFDSNGGEDMDYCLRCHLHGKPVLFANPSYIIHFQGKSTWRSGEDDVRTKERNRKVFETFTSKWGQDVYDFFVMQKQDVLKKYDLKIQQAYQNQDYKTVINAMSKS